MQSKNPLQWHIQENPENLMVQLSGELNRHTLLPLWKQREAFLSPKKNQTIYWHLQGISQIDSAGFTLLIELLHQYQQQHTNYILHLPESVEKLAALFGLNDWLSPFLCSEKK